MEDTYSDFISRAESSVNSLYAKQLLEEIRDKNSVSEALYAIADFDFGSILQIPTWIKSAVILLSILLLIYIIQDVFKSAVVYASIRQMLLLVIAATLLLPIYTLLQDVQTYMNDLSLFLGVLTPTIGALAASGGNVAFASSTGTLLSVFLSVTQILINKIIPIVIMLFLGFAMLDTFFGEKKMLSLSKLVRNTLFGAFSIFASVFFILISCQSITAANTDTVSARTLRLLVSNAVPIVGGTIGDALKLVGGGLVTVKNAVGTTAVVFLLAMYLPALLITWGSGIFLNLFGFLCEYFGFSEVEGLLTHLKCAIDFSIAGFTFVFVVGIVNIGIFMSVLPVVIA